MKISLAAHPPWRQLLTVAIALPALAVLAVLAFAWPAARIQPRGVPVGIVGTSIASQQVISHLSSVEPGAFDFHLYADASSAAAAIRDRDIYGAFDVTPQQVQIREASAASPAVAQLLTSVGARVAADAGPAEVPQRASIPRLTTTDVVPLSPSDPKGVVFSSSLLPLTICSILFAAAIGVVVKFRPAWRQIVALVVVSAVAGAGTYLVAQGALGALPDNGLADWVGLTLTLLAMSAATAGLIALIGPFGLGIAAAVMVFVGNPFSGATSAPELLPDGVNHIGQWLPPGAGANLLRSTAYFDGNGAGGHIAVLVGWIVFGLAAVIVGHHAPIRFAARRPTPAPSPNPHVPEHASAF